jgi:hypothetical protein
LSGVRVAAAFVDPLFDRCPRESTHRAACQRPALRLSRLDILIRGDSARTLLPVPRGRLFRIALVVLAVWLILGLLAVWAWSSGGSEPGSGGANVVTVART